MWAPALGVEVVALSAPSKPSVQVRDPYRSIIQRQEAHRRLICSRPDSKLPILAAASPDHGAERPRYPPGACVLRSPVASHAALDGTGSSTQSTPPDTVAWGSKSKDTPP